MRSTHACLLLAAALGCASATLAHAQDAAGEPLRVYVTLVQIPVLLLNQYRSAAPRIDSSRFVVTLEGAPPFRPKHVRLQGDDPISLTLLVDGSDAGERLWAERLPAALEDLQKNLRPHDTVEVLAWDGCAARMFGGEEHGDAPALRTHLAEAVAVKSYATLRKQMGPCATPTSLWEVMTRIAEGMETRGGRRVLFVFSNGQPDGPAGTMAKLQDVMMLNSVTAFGVEHEVPSTPDASVTMQSSSPNTPQRGGRAARPSQVTVMFGDESPASALEIQCEKSGGMGVQVTSRSLPKTLAQLAEVVRNRYILEFPRPDSLRAGLHLMQVSDGNPRDFIRPAGITFPLADPKEAPDPAVERKTAEDAAAAVQAR